MIQKRSASFRRDVLKLASGTAIAQIVGLAAAPVLTRLFDPTAFGVASLFASVTGILAVLACLRYELSILLPETDEEAANLLALSLGITVVISLLTIPIVWSVRDRVLTWINAPELEPLLWLIPIAVFTSGTYATLNFWNTRTKNFTRLSIANVVSQLVTAGSNITLGFGGYTTGGSLVGGSVAGQIMATTVLSSELLRHSGRFFLNSVSWYGILSGMKRYRKFPIFSSWGALINAASWHIPVLMLGAFFSPAIVGFYSLGLRLIQVPMSLVGGAIGQVFFQRGAAAKSKIELSELVENLYGRLLVMCLFPAMMLMVIGSDMISVVFGEEWREAGVYLQILGPWVVVWFISSPLSSIYFIQERQKSELLMHSIIFSARVVAISIGAYFSDARMAILLLTVAGTISYGNLLYRVFIFAGVDLTLQLERTLKAIVIALVFVAPLIVVKHLFEYNSFIQFSLAILSISLYFLWHRKAIISDSL